MASAAASFVTEMAMAHVPVLTDELLDLLDVRPRQPGGGLHVRRRGARRGGGGLSWVPKVCWSPATRIRSPRTTTWT